MSGSETLGVIGKNLKAGELCKGSWPEKNVAAKQVGDRGIMMSS